MNLRLLSVSALCVTLMAGCAHSPRGGHGHVRVSGHGGGVAAVAVGIGIGALVANVISRPKYEVGHKPAEVPRDARDIHFHGATYRYHDGVYYRKMEGAFHVVRPPPGIRVHTLPPKPDVIVIDGETYYVAEGVYYYKSGDDYIVVDEPKVSAPRRHTTYVSGQFYSDLPSQAKPVKINGIQYFTYEGLFFLPQPVNGSVRYLVVELND